MNHSLLPSLAPEAAVASTGDVVRSRKRLLEPHERISEILFGLIMVLTFTGSLSVADAGRDDVRVMLIGALGCNLAWGIIDAILYLMGCLAEKGQSLKRYQALRLAKDPEKARQLLRNALPSPLSDLLQPEELDTFRQRLMTLPEPPTQVRLSRENWLAALGVLALVFLSTFPVALPFMFSHNTYFAMRVSNGIAVLLLFLAGSAYGKCVGRSPVVFGISMVVLGLLLVGLTMALGG